MEICGVLGRVLGGFGESYLGLSKEAVVSSITGDKRPMEGFDNEENHSCIDFIFNVAGCWKCFC